MTYPDTPTSTNGEIRWGAAALAERAADVLLRRANAGEAPSPDAFRQEILMTGWSLIQATDASAPLVNLVNLVLWKIEERETIDGLRQAVTEATGQFKRQLKQHALQVAEGTLRLIGEGNTLVTISHSSTVLRALVYAQHTGRRFSVVCAESQPALEGRAMAEQLAHHGVSVTVVSDAAAIAAVAQANLVLVGADMLSSAGLMNKVGTRALALAAQAANLPTYTLCSSEKFLPPGFPLTHADPANAPTLQPDVDVLNREFDTTPLNEIAGIVTEQGILPAAAIEAWLAATKLHPALAVQPWHGDGFED